MSFAETALNRWPAPTSFFVSREADVHNAGSSYLYNDLDLKKRKTFKRTLEGMSFKERGRENQIWKELNDSLKS